MMLFIYDTHDKVHRSAIQLHNDVLQIKYDVSNDNLDSAPKYDVSNDRRESQIPPQ
jgi:hypothetical protein